MALPVHRRVPAASPRGHLGRRGGRGSPRELAVTTRGSPRQYRPTGTLTFLLTDIEGSTRLWERQPGQMRTSMVRHDELIEALVAEYRGAVVRPRGEGDSRFAVFARASDAVAAACAIQRAFAHESWGTSEQLRVRMAVHTGEAEWRSGDYYGSDVNRCARLRSIAHGGQTILSGVTADLVRQALPPAAGLRELGSHRLKDVSAPERVYQLLHPELRDQFPPLESHSLPRHNLPVQVSTFVGRDNEIERLLSLLARTRLLTLVGAGGVGKTRLALRIAEELCDVFPEGVRLVELAAVADPELIPGALASVLEVREQADCPIVSTLVTHLAQKRILLVLDNCEHVLDSCARLTEALLRGCPHLQILATSREVLGVAGETTWWVPSLSTPSTAQLPVEQLAEFEAVQLFVDRAVAKRPDFRLTRGNASAVSEVCRRLDGIPLAIELAAALVSLLPVQHIADRLNDRFGLLTRGSRTGPTRHHTLRAAVAWSYDMLTDPERLLFERLSVFTGGWTLDAAETVCADDQIQVHQVLELLGRLVDKSLVVVEDTTAEARYRFLETIRQFAWDKLVADRAPDVLLRRHVDYFIALGEQASGHLRQGALWLDKLHREQDNLRSALHWCSASGDVDRGLQLGGSIWRLWYLRGSPSEGRECLQTILRLAPGSAKSARRARALNGAGVLATQQGDFQTAQAVLEESLGIWRDIGDQSQIGSSLNNLGMVALHRGDHDRAQLYLQEALTSARAAGDMVRVAIVLANLEFLFEEQGDCAAARDLGAQSTAVFAEVGDKAGTAGGLAKQGYWALREGDVAGARALCERGLSLAREVGDAPQLAWALLDLALVRIREEDWVSARSLLEESLGLCGYAYADDQALVPLCLAALAAVAAAQRNPERALRLFGAASGLRELAPGILHPRRRLAGPPFDARSVEQWLPAVKVALGKKAVAAVWEAGHALSSEDAITEALASDAPQHPAQQKRAGGLTDRETDVVRLVAQGRTNREIAAVLVVARSTVERHVANILNKLGLHTRGQVAVWAVTHGFAAPATATPT